MNTEYPHEIRDRSDIPEDEIEKWTRLTDTEYVTTKALTPDERATWLARRNKRRKKRKDAREAKASRKKR